MAKELSVVHHAERWTDVVMPYAPATVEVSPLATHARRKLEISGAAVVDEG
ncbi:MAG: hypothetical protein ACE5JD_13005 [Candidatus Methylomirabilia bacterium]